MIANTDNKPLSVGMIGSGLIAHLQASALLRVPLVRIDAVLARSGARAFADMVHARNQGEAQLCYSVDELCRKVDAVAVLAPPFAQLDLVQQIAAAKHQGARVRGVMIDKPLGRNVSEARAIVATLKNAQLLSAYFENQIHMPAVRKQRAALHKLQDGAGAPLLVRSAEEHSGPHSAWFWDPKRAGGGVLLDMACHSIAVAWHLLTPVGKPLTYLEPVRVQCMTAHLKWQQRQWRQDLAARLRVPLEQEIGEDYASGWIAFAYPESDQIVGAQFTNSWMYDRGGLKLTIETLGAGYGFHIDTQQSGLSYYSKDAGACALLPDEGDTYGYVEEFQDAYQCFMQGRDALLNADYGASITRLMMACYLAAETAACVDLRDQHTAETLENYVPRAQR